MCNLCASDRDFKVSQAVDNVQARAHIRQYMRGCRFGASRAAQLGSMR
jgi:hypothetical protein